MCRNGSAHYCSHRIPSSLHLQMYLNEFLVQVGRTGEDAASDDTALDAAEPAMHCLNHRPSECLDFKMPHEALMNQLHSRHNAFALQY